MKRPWQIWTAYAIALLVTAAAVAGVTVHAWKSDRAERETRAQAALEENVRLALWRMDSMLVPIVSQESARSPAEYQILIDRKSSPGKDSAGTTRSGAPQDASVPFPEDVRAYFDLTANRLDLGVSPERGTGTNSQALEATVRSRLSNMLNFKSLIAQLPATAENESTQIANGENLAEPIQILEPSSISPQQAIVPQGEQAKTRGRQEYQARAQYMQNNYAVNNSVVGRNNGLVFPNVSGVKTGAIRPVLMGDELVLARQVGFNGKSHVQGCWLDWPAIRTRLLKQVADLLPQANLQLIAPSSDVDAARRLASLPVKVEIPASAMSPTGSASAPLQLTLGIAWGSLLLAAVAVAFLLSGVLALSERRASFVSAVTHELRTPLTTFRMYAEMLAEGMVPDEENRRRYLQTLRTEADRLSHLVENVLAYARLERGGLGNRVRAVKVGEMVETAVSRSRDRAAQSHFTVELNVSDDVGKLTASADPSAVEQIIFNLVDNAAKYANSAVDRRIEINVGATDRRVTLAVRDHGPGISLAEQRRLFEPFRKSASEAAATAPGVGLGLALSRRLARDMGGDLAWDDSSHGGAGFVLSLRRADR